MSMSSSFITLPATSTAATYKPDLRPTADAAAMARASRPAPAIAVSGFDPPSTTQSAAISRSMIGPAQDVASTDATAEKRVEQVSRTLKPYGVAMLPDAAGTRRDTGSEGPPPSP